MVREHIAADGSSLPGCQGRLLTPGHALEAGWFLLQEAKIRSVKGQIDTSSLGLHQQAPLKDKLLNCVDAKERMHYSIYCPPTLQKR